MLPVAGPVPQVPAGTFLIRTSREQNAGNGEMEKKASQRMDVDVAQGSTTSAAKPRCCVYLAQRHALHPAVISPNVPDLAGVADNQSDGFPTKGNGNIS